MFRSSRPSKRGIEVGNGDLTDLKPGTPVSLWFAASGGRLGVRTIQVRK
jgi:hypothetical protein